MEREWLDDDPEFEDFADEFLELLEDIGSLDDDELDDDEFEEELRRIEDY